MILPALIIASVALYKIHATCILIASDLILHEAHRKLKLEPTADYNLFQNYLGLMAILKAAPPSPSRSDPTRSLL